MFDYSYETTQRLKVLSIAGFVSMIAAVSTAHIVYTNQETKWQQLLLSKGYGEYNKKSGEWQLCEPEVVLLNRNTDAIKILNGGTVTINDYLKIVEGDLKDAQVRIETQAKELIEQDLQLEKYKKSIKIPEKSVKNSSKSDKRPLESFDPSVVVSPKKTNDLK